MSFTSELRAALDDAPHPTDAADRVHHLVANALRRLDADAEIKRTHYFTHTIVPDLVLRWGPEDGRRERHVHLRFTVDRESFAQDLDLLGSDSPLFLGMTDQGNLEHPRWAGAHANANGSLITQSQAIDELGEHAGQETRTRKATGTLVRLGRGVIDEPRAEQVSDRYFAALSAMTAVTTATDSAREAVQSALSTIDDYLPEEGQLEVERALHSEWVRGGGDPYEFPGSTPWNPELLDEASLRDVLTSLLDSGFEVQPETWQRNASFIRVEDLGRVLGRSLRGGSFNAMAHALLPYWTAKWVWAERHHSPPLEPTYEWIIDNGIVGLEANDLRAFFADDGRHFKDKPGGNPLPLLIEAQQMLSQPGLQQVGLKGLMEGIRYEPLATAAAQVYTRIKALLNMQTAASYRVHSVIAAVPGTDGVADIDLDRQVIDLGGQSTPVATLAQMANRFFSRATRPEGIEHFLATREPPAFDELTGTATAAEEENDEA
jgi:hypothetical protein